MPVLKIFFSFRGRTNRLTFWLSLMAAGLVPGFLGLAAVAAATLYRTRHADQLATYDPVTSIELILSLPCIAVGIWAGLAVQVKRWHDRGKSGWMVLINLIPILGTLWSLVELGFLKGSTGPTRYGEEPASAGASPAHGTHLVLGAFPMALLSLTTPVVPAMWQVTQGFQRLAEEGTGGAQGAVAVAALCLGVVRPLWLGTVVFLAALVACGAIQLLATRVGRHSPHGSDTLGSVSARWGGYVLITSFLLMVFVAVLIRRSQSIGAVIMLVSDPQQSPEAREAVMKAFAGGGIEQFSDVLGSEIMLAVMAASALSAALVAFAITNVLTISSSKAPNWLAQYVWVLCGVAGAAAAWNLIGLGNDIRWFQQAMR